MGLRLQRSPTRGQVGSRIIHRYEDTNEHVFYFIDRRVKIQITVGRIQLHFLFRGKRYCFRRHNNVRKRCFHRKPC